MDKVVSAMNVDRKIVDAIGRMEETAKSTAWSAKAQPKKKKVCCVKKANTRVSSFPSCRHVRSAGFCSTVRANRSVYSQFNTFADCCLSARGTPHIFCFHHT